MPKVRECNPLFVTMDPSCKQYFKRDSILQLCTSNSLLQYRLPCPPLIAEVCWLVGCLTSQQQASVSQGRICSDNFTCYHTEIKVADQTFYLTQSQYTDTRPTSPSADPITPGAWQGNHWSANFEVTGMTRPRKKIPAQTGFEPGIFRSRGGRLNHQANEAVNTNRGVSDPDSGLTESNISFGSSDSALVCTTTAAREAVGCNRYFMAAVRHGFSLLLVVWC